MQKRKKHIGLVATDLDGTLLNDDRKVSRQNIKTLQMIGEKRVIRIIATGRSYYSFKQVIPPDFPMDYLVFSTGAGIMDWKTQDLIFSRYLPAEKVEDIIRMLWMEKVDFMVHHAIPDNHYFDYYSSGYANPDFYRRCHIYNDFGQCMSNEVPWHFNATQILVVLPPENKSKFDELASQMKDVKVVKTTSPLDYESIWMEIFPPEVSKGKAIEWLCDFENVDVGNSIGVGNDFNDIDLLRATAYSYVVKNAPQSLKDEFIPTLGNNNDGFACVIDCHLGSE